MRPMKTIGTLAIATTLTAFLTGCPKDKTADGPMTQAEAREAMEESTVESQASALTTNSVEITTSFTIGKAVKDSAAEILSSMAISSRGHTTRTFWTHGSARSGRPDL